VRFRFLHAADLHLDTPFEGIRRVEPFVADALRDASLRAFESLVSLAIAREVAFVVLAGDIYDGPERGVRAQLTFRRGLDRLSDAGIATFVVHGNHDPVETGWSAVRSWPAGVKVFGADEVATVPVERDGEMIASVHGISYPTRAVTENLALRFARGDAPGIQVGLLHANVGANPQHDPYSPCTLDDLRAGGMDYWALGHVHARQVLSQGDPWAVYPGNLQGRSPKASERGPKGALVVEVDGTTIAAPEFVPLDRVRFAYVEADIADLADLPELQELLTELALREARAAEGRSVLLRAALVGAGPVADDLRRPGAVAELLGALRDGVRREEPFVWWEHLADLTRPALDLDALRRRGDFPGELLLLADDLSADPERLHAFAEQHLAAVATPTLDRLAGPLEDPAEPMPWRQAVDLALTTLVTDDG